ncbi:glycosyltransferase family 2 protein [Pontivivens nitratireducens]|uniref:Glycosyltransferase family 2 protein n=1 Tax=Pontivivens nitratireducens TaxID=2758038 RepID=A0A6G7VR10_9RHOB|nr:glycosyltransferase family 2 protein [Pontibrevibacter nitratireducens]QIK42315.1 glycosyltransferase family 2 protein [Pontibrevibacter nitratireducens]
MAGTGPLIISTMKNEGPYILEWVAYHRAIGFADFLIYTNDCEDGTVELLDRLTERGIVQHERNKVLRRGPHKSALKAARVHPVTLAAEWMLISDVDEFLNIHIGDGSVQAMLDALPDDTDAVPVTWKLFTHDDQVAFEDRLLIEQFTDAQKSLEDGGVPDRFVKTIFRGQHRVERFGLHRPVVAEEHVEGYTSRHPDGVIFNGNMRHSKANTHFAYDAAQINHYAVRSIDSYLVKRDRGRANHAGQVLGADYWQRMCLGGERDLSIQRHLPAVQAGLAELRADPETARLHDQAVIWHRDKIEALRQRPEFAALHEEVMALARAGDHLRNFDDAPMPLRQVAQAAPDPEPVAAPAVDADSRARLRDLAAQMRPLIDHVSPSDAASAAHSRLDEIERGLFGKTSR